MASRRLLSSSSLLLLLPFLLANGPCGGSEDDPPADEVCPAALVLAGERFEAEGVEHVRLDEDEVWRAADSPHVVPDHVSIAVAEGRQLTIEPCAVVVMGEGAGLTVGTGWGEEAHRGALVAAGTADRPILVTGAEARPGYWAGIAFEESRPETRLSHVVLQHGGAYSGFTGTLHATGAFLTNRVLLDHVTVRDGEGPGIRFEARAELAPGSGHLTVTGVSGFPVEISEASVRSLPDGAYTGNGDDRIRLIAEGAVVEKEVGPVSWPRLSVPYLYDIGSYQNWLVDLTLAPGVHVYVRPEPEYDWVEDNGVWGFFDGGSLQAVGTSEQPIVIEGEAPGAPTWAGLWFDQDANVPSSHAGPSVMAYVTLSGAGGVGLLDSACTDLEDQRAAIGLGLDCLTMTHTTIVDAGPSAYAVGRIWCGDGSQQFSSPALGNAFVNLHCPETDQYPCSPPGGGCEPDLACCDHPYVCHGEVE